MSDSADLKDDRIDPVGPTMFDAPSRVLVDVKPGEIVFVGAPIDAGTTHVPGARFGPRALRAASVERYNCQIDPATGQMRPWPFHALGGSFLGNARLCDLGDVGFMPGEPMQGYYDRLRSVTREIYGRGGFPIVLGGDHSITWANVPETPFDLVHLDAHSDLAPVIDGHCHHHGNVLTRLEAESPMTGIFNIGLRDDSDRDDVTARMAELLAPIPDNDPNWATELAGSETFITLDVDVLDPSILPGTGTPVAGGLSLDQLCRSLKHLAETTRPLGLDIVELCPLRDESANSERAVVEALLWFLIGLHENPRTHL